MKSNIKPKLEVLVGPEEINVVVPSEYSDSLEAFLKETRLSFTIDRNAIVTNLSSDNVFNFLYEEDVPNLQMLLEAWSDH